MMNTKDIDKTEILLRIGKKYQRQNRLFLFVKIMTVICRRNQAYLPVLEKFCQITGLYYEYYRVSPETEVKFNGKNIKIPKNLNKVELNHFLLQHCLGEQYKAKQFDKNDSIFNLFPVGLKAFIARYFLDHRYTELDPEAYRVLLNWLHQAGCSEEKLDYLFNCEIDEVNEMSSDLFELSECLDAVSQEVEHAEKISFLSSLSNKTFAQSSNNIGNFPRIAILISGIFRASNSLNTKALAPLMSELNADIFVATWDQSQTWSGVGGDHHVRRLFGPKLASLLPLEYQSISSFSSSFPQTFKVLEKPIFTKTNIEDESDSLTSWKLFDSDASTNFFNTAPSLKKHINQSRMFYLMKQCFELCFEHEKKIGKKYDAYVRIRPDLHVFNVDKKEFLNDIRNGVLATTYQTSYGFGDQCFWGSRDAMLGVYSVCNKIFQSNSFSILNGGKEAIGEKLLGLSLLEDGNSLRRSDGILTSGPGFYQESSIVNILPDLLDAALTDGLHTKCKQFFTSLSQL